MESVIVIAKDNELCSVIGAYNVAARATCDVRWSDDDGEIDVVKFQLGGFSCGHLGEINHEGFCLGIAATCGCG